MVNEEDHLRMQVLRSGLQLEEAWEQINAIDDALEGKLDFASTRASATSPPARPTSAPASASA